MFLFVDPLSCKNFSESIMAEPWVIIALEFVLWMNMLVNTFNITPHKGSGVFLSYRTEHKGPKVSAPKSNPENNA